MIHLVPFTADDIPRREGVRREALCVGGERWSEVLMSILAPEWSALRARDGT